VNVGSVFSVCSRVAKPQTHPRCAVHEKGALQDGELAGQIQHDAEQVGVVRRRLQPSMKTPLHQQPDVGVHYLWERGRRLAARQDPEGKWARPSQNKMSTHFEKSGTPARGSTAKIPAANCLQRGQEQMHEPRTS
jgi:hypothetical protein